MADGVTVTASATQLPNRRSSTLDLTPFGLEEVVLGHLREMRSDGTLRSRVIDLVRVAVLNLAGSERHMVANYIVDDPWVRG